MLAWVHQSAASEREFMVSLFGEDADVALAGGGAGGEVVPADSDAPTIAQLLDGVFESICRPLKVRAGVAG